MIALLAAFVIAPLQTAQDAPSIDKRMLGQWDVTPHAKGKEMIYEFKDDGSATFIMSADIPGIKSTVWLKIVEAYRVDGDTLAMKPAEAHFLCKDSSKKDILATIEQQYQKMVVDAPPGRGPITWVDKDNIFFQITTPAVDQRKSETKLVVLKRRKGKIPVLPGEQKKAEEKSK